MTPIEIAGPARGDPNPYRGAGGAPLIHTYSIVARDPESGQLGVAVQSHYFAVGSIVTWAEAGVGAIATQSVGEPSYGKLGLDLMRAGVAAPDALSGLLVADRLRELRQVAMVDAHGRVSAHTGQLAIAEAGHLVGEGFSVQANIMERATVWPAMANAYQHACGDLAERMLAALDAAEAEGGDLRGRQSAAMLIVDAASTGRPWIDCVFDVRVDDHPLPLVELRRLVSIRRAFRHKATGDAAFANGSVEVGEREYAAAERLTDDAEFRLWHAVGLVNAGQVDDALKIFRELFAADRRWLELAERLSRQGAMFTDPASIQRILDVAPRA
ncbi:MAG TPA: DUF1028 domain-containing protein [Candidatus Binataceae bacterium]